jgi:uncharacterized protein (DUF3084 family)
MTELLSIQHHKIHERLQQQTKQLQTRVKDLQEQIIQLRQLEHKIRSLEYTVNALQSFIVQQFPNEIGQAFSLTSWVMNKEFNENLQNSITNAKHVLEHNGFTVIENKKDNGTTENT